MRFSMDRLKPPLLVAILALGGYNLAQRLGLSPEGACAVLYVGLAIGSAILGQFAQDPLQAAWQGYIAALMAFALVPVPGSVGTDVGRAVAAAGFLGLAPAYLANMWLSPSTPTGQRRQ